ncbi:MAG: helix-turn-helix domain-containing protein [Lachnospiraceae bacterium]|nr:helix-turn-helix domain-containing protein [Lachnospiraceae bacterium]
MNGLRFVRRLCNFSLNELSKEIGVSRQAISAWENNKKGISEDRLLQILDFFGIEKEYLGEITEEAKQQILEKAMYRYKDGDREYYKYKPHCCDTLENEVVCFLGNNDRTLDDYYAEALKNKKAIIDEARNLISYQEGGSKESDIISINRGVNIYGAVNAYLREMPDQKVSVRMPYWQELDNILNALLIAHDQADKEEIADKYQVLSMDPTNDDYEWTLELAEILRSRWERKRSKYANIKMRPGSVIDEHKTGKSVEEMIKEMEDANREFWKINKDMAYKVGLQFRPGR